jgi:glycosyltransferase involved in cell wall biosynthesis
MSARILFLDYTNGIGLGGGQRSLQLLLEELDPSRFEPVLVCPPGERLLEMIPGHVRVRELPLPQGFRGLSRRGADWGAVCATLPSLRRAAARLRSILQDERPAVLHSNNLKMHLLASAASAGLGIPRIWHVRDILPPSTLAKTMKRAGAAVSAKVLAVSRAVARQLPPKAPVKVLYNAVRLPEVSRLGDGRGAVRARLGLAPDACLTGYCGRLDRGKGIDVLIGAFADVRGRHPHAGLLIAGDGPERPALERLARGLGVAEAVLFTGFQSGLTTFYGALDVAAVPSTEPDSFPRSAIEAMAHGLPVVGTDSGGIPEAIQDGVTGFVVPAGDAHALAQSLGALASDAALRRRQGRAGRQRAERLFSAEAQARAISALYRELAPGL